MVFRRYWHTAVSQVLALGLLQDLLQFRRDTVPGWLEQLVEQCIRRNPEERPPSAATVAGLLSSQVARLRSPTLKPDKHEPFVERRAAGKAFESFRRDPKLR